MTKGVILVDFDNVFYGRNVTAANIKSQLEDFIAASLALCPQAEAVLIRLYGGWKMNAQYTAQASRIMGYIESVRSELFPYIFQSRRVQGDLELVTSQYNLEIEWDNTLQEKSARHFLNIRQDTTHTCHHNPDHCPLHLVAKATRGHHVVCPIDGCEHIDVSQLTRMEQKMVDSMMTCDILEYTHDEECQLIEVVSDDIDLHPALALAGEKYSVPEHVALLLMIGNQKNRAKFNQLLGSHHVTIQTW